MMHLANKIAIVTGAASGIGREIAISLAKRHCKLILADINEDGLQETATYLTDAPALCYRLDVGDEQEIARFYQKINEQYEHIDVLVNNAGVALGGTFEMIDATDFDWLISINFMGLVRMTRAFLPLLKKSQKARLVNMSSIFGIIAPPGQTAYAASKFAVRGFSDALRNELASSNVGVTVVHPGGVATNIAKSARRPKAISPELVKEHVERADSALSLSPEIAAEIIVKGIEEGKDRVLVGNDAKIATLVARLFPQSYWKILKRLSS